MSYETKFSVSIFANGNATIDREQFSKSVKKTIKNRYKDIVEHMSDNRNYDKQTVTELVEDWHEFLTGWEGQYQSMAYEYLDVFIDIARQIVKDKLCDDVCIEFTWHGEESGDHTKNVYYVRKKGDDIKLIREKEVITTVEEVIDRPSSICRQYRHD